MKQCGAEKMVGIFKCPSQFPLLRILMAGLLPPQQLGSTMYQAADNLFKLLQNLLEWAQMQSGSASIVLKDILLTNMITEYVEAIKVRSEQKGISIINMVTEPIYAYADEKMINSVLMNFLSNMITEYVEAIKVRSEQKGISIINMVTEPIYAYADEKMINSVLMNLLSN